MKLYRILRHFVGQDQVVLQKNNPYIFLLNSLAKQLKTRCIELVSDKSIKMAAILSKPCPLLKSQSPFLSANDSNLSYAFSTNYPILVRF